MLPARGFDPGQGDRLEAFVCVDEGSFDPAGQPPASRLGAHDQGSLEDPGGFQEPKPAPRGLLTRSLQTHPAELSVVEGAKASALHPEPLVHAWPQGAGLVRGVRIEQPIEFLIVEEQTLGSCVLEQPIHPTPGLRDRRVPFRTLFWKT